jgi:hypothetical protein
MLFLKKALTSIQQVSINGEKDCKTEAVINFMGTVNMAK